MLTLTTHVQDATDTDLLVAFLDGDCDARNELPRRLHGKLIVETRHLAPDLLHRDLQEDVVQQMWLLLLRMNPGSYDPQRSAPMTFLSKLLLRARRDVYAQFTPPGARTRSRKKTGRLGIPSDVSVETRSTSEPSNLVERREAISLDFLMASEQSLVDYIPDAMNIEETAVDAINTAHLLDRLQEIAPRPIFTILNATVSGELSLSEAAKIVGMKVPRQTINRWVTQQQLTLAMFHQM